MGMSLNKLQELVMDREAQGAAVHGISKNQTRLSDWIQLWHLHLDGVNHLKHIISLLDLAPVISTQGNHHHKLILSWKLQIIIDFFNS